MQSLSAISKSRTQWYNGPSETRMLELEERGGLQGSVFNFIQKWKLIYKLRGWGPL